MESQGKTVLQDKDVQKGSFVHPWTHFLVLVDLQFLAYVNILSVCCRRKRLRYKFVLFEYKILAMLTTQSQSVPFQIKLMQTSFFSEAQKGPFSLYTVEHDLFRIQPSQMPKRKTQWSRLEEKQLRKGFDTQFITYFNVLHVV